MKIQSVTLANFRSYRESQTFDNLSNVNTFIGPNASGKSNVLEALKWVQSMVLRKASKPFSEVSFDRNPDAEISLSLTFELSEEEREKILESFGMNTEKKNNVKGSSFLRNLRYSITVIATGIKQEELKISNTISGDAILFFKGIDKSQISRLNVRSIDLEKKRTNLENMENIVSDITDHGSTDRGFLLLNFQGSSKTEMLPVEQLRQFIQGWQWTEPNREIETVMPPGESAELSSTGNNLTKFMNNLLGQDRKEYNDIAAEVTQIFPKINDVNTPYRNANVTLTVKEDGLTTQTDVGNVSSGLKQVLILVAKIASEKAKPLLMIEEPELHLHASAQRKLFELIQKHSNKTQFFLTTHSTIFAECDNSSQTYLVTKPEGASKVERIQCSKDLAIAKNALGHKNVDLFGDECVVFVEGDSEEIAFPIIAQSLGYDLTRKGIRLINIKGSGKAGKMEEYLRYLSTSGIQSYVILDGNKQIKEKLQDWQREGIIKQGNWTIWNLEFEDCFSFDTISKAINELFGEKGIKLSVDQLRENKREGVTIVKYIKSFLREKDVELDKPELAEKLAKIVCQEGNNPNREKTGPEKEIEKIVELVG